MASTTSVTDPVEVDWETADIVAARLGRATRELVAERDADAVQHWCLQMAGSMVGDFNATRGLSYVELAVIAGHRQSDTVDHARRNWVALQQRAQQLVQEATLLTEAVKAKAKQEREAAKAAAETDAKPADDDDSDTSPSPSADEQRDLYEVEGES